MTRNTPADYRIVFTTPGTPPRQLRNVRTAADPDMPDWLVFEDELGRPAWMAPRECVLFVERLKHRDSEDASDQPAPAEIREGGFDIETPTPMRDGLAKVAAAITSARGGEPHPQIRGFG